MDFGNLTAYLDSLLDLGIPSLDLAIHKDHELIYRHMAGTRSPEGEPLTGDEVYRLYSCSKVFTTCAVMQLVEKGVLSLDDPVSRYMPAWGNITVRDGEGSRPAARPMLVRHLMSMQSGLDYNMDTPALRKLISDTKGLATTRELMDAKAEDPLCFDPGSDFQYSLSHDVLGALIEAACGLRFSEYLKKNIWEPLGLPTMTFRPDEATTKRFCAQYRYLSDKNVFVPIPIEGKMINYESGGGGLFGDVHDYSLFVDALASGGRGKDGAHILSPEMIQLWSANQLCPKGRKSFDSWNRSGYSYALGVRTRVTNSIGGLGPVGEFGWDGAACSWAMIDPHNHVSAFLAMHVMDYGYAFSTIHPTVRHKIYEVLG